jgi:hypothetical protein
LKTSIVITTNRDVGEWGDVLGDTTMAAAMLDRLLHRSVVINLDGVLAHTPGSGITDGGRSTADQRISPLTSGVSYRSLTPHGR